MMSQPMRNFRRRICVICFVLLFFFSPPIWIVPSPIITARFTLNIYIFAFVCRTPIQIQNFSSINYKFVSLWIKCTNKNRKIKQIEDIKNAFSSAFDRYIRIEFLNGFIWRTHTSKRHTRDIFTDTSTHAVWCTTISGRDKYGVVRSFFVIHSNRLKWTECVW